MVWGMGILYDYRRFLLVSLKMRCLLEDAMKDEWGYHISRLFFERV